MPKEGILRFLLIMSLFVLAALPAHATPMVSGSYYHHKFEGRPMACGGRYDGEELTAASNHHPCGSLVRVSRGERSVIVLITDRCGRCGIDLSVAAAREIGLKYIGRAPVRVERLD
jgi:rare lipoprotein A